MNSYSILKLIIIRYNDGFSLLFILYIHLKNYIFKLDRSSEQIEHMTNSLKISKSLLMVRLISNSRILNFYLNDITILEKSTEKRLMTLRFRHKSSTSNKFNCVEPTNPKQRSSLGYR